MSRGWNWLDLLGIGNLTGDPDPIWGSLSGENAIKDATAAQQAALEKAFNVIQEYTGKAIEQQKPYTQHAGEDFNRQRGLVQSGYFQTPYGRSFHPQQYAPSGFSINPGQGQASFRPQSFGLMGYTPQGLPPMPNLPAYQPPAQQQGPMGGQQPNLPPLQTPQQSDPRMGQLNTYLTGLFGSGPMDYAKRVGGDLIMPNPEDVFRRSVIPNPLNPLGPIAPITPEGRVMDDLTKTALNTKASTGNDALDFAINNVIDPRAPIRMTSDAIGLIGDAGSTAKKKILKYLGF